MFTAPRFTLVCIVSFAVALACVISSLRADDSATTQPAKEPVDYKKLKELLPDTLVDIKRTDAKGEKVAAGEMKLSQAQGTYGSKEGDNPPTIDLTIVDYGAAPGVAEGMAVWSKLDIDQESDSGYEKTTKVGGFPALIQFQNDGKHGTLQIFVADRFMVTAESHNLADDQFKKIGDALPLDKLAALKQ
jgi:hypothetical protein